MTDEIVQYEIEAITVRWKESRRYVLRDNNLRLVIHPHLWLAMTHFCATAVFYPGFSCPLFEEFLGMKVIKSNLIEGWIIQNENEINEEAEAAIMAMSK